MANLFLAPTTNYLTKVLNGAINDTTDTITLNNTTNLQAPGYIVINRENSAGTATPNSREVVSYTGISGSDLTGCDRGADGSTARSHADGSLVETMPTVGMWNSLATILDKAVNNDGYLKAINSPVSISRVQGIQGIFTSVLSVAELQTLDITRFSTNSVASITEIRNTRLFGGSATITTSINASGASVTGFLPSGASGAVLVSRGNETVPVYAAVPRVKVGTITRDLTAVSGNVATTGVGFKPSLVFFFTNVSNNNRMSFGADAGSSSGMTIYDNLGNTDNTYDNSVSGGASILAMTSTGTRQFANINSLDADGFTLAWTKDGSPTGTLTIIYVAIG